MKGKLFKIANRILISTLSFVNLFQAKLVHAQVVYAPPEVLEKEARVNLFFDFVKTYTVLVILISLLVLVGFISIIWIFLGKFLGKNKKQTIQPPKTTH